jgi:uncharacterized protein (DUF427 family)
MSERTKESVWDFPKPPALEHVDRHVLATGSGHVIVDSHRPIRILETSHPPVYYIPRADVAVEFLEPSPHTTYCEYKGRAHYYSLVCGGQRRSNGGWYYPHPCAGYEELADYVAFYAWAFDEVSVDGEKVRPQPGHFYGGWITSEIEGPFKGEPARHQGVVILRFQSECSPDAVRAWGFRLQTNLQTNLPRRGGTRPLRSRRPDWLEQRPLRGYQRTVGRPDTGGVAMSVEHPEYEVLRHDGPLELRRYPQYLTASVRVPASGYNQAAYAGFRPLADYIFGNNAAAGSISMTAPVTASRSAGTKIAMTAPVTSERVRSEQLGAASPLCTVQCAGEYTVRFTMPSRFATLEELPEPNDRRVTLEAVPAHLAAVARFSGRLDDEAVAEAVRSLEAWIGNEGLVAAGEPEAAQYDAPWKPGFARHNEVLIPVRHS